MVTIVPLRNSGPPKVTTKYGTCLGSPPSYDPGNDRPRRGVLVRDWKMQRLRTQFCPRFTRRVGRDTGSPAGRYDVRRGTCVTVDPRGIEYQPGDYLT